MKVHFVVLCSANYKYIIKLPALTETCHGTTEFNYIVKNAIFTAQRFSSFSCTVFISAFHAKVNHDKCLWLSWLYSVPYIKLHSNLIIIYQGNSVYEKISVCLEKFSNLAIILDEDYSQKYVRLLVRYLSHMSIQRN